MRLFHWQKFIGLTLLVLGILFRLSLVQAAVAANLDWIAFQRAVMTPPEIADTRAAQDWLAAAREGRSSGKMTIETQIMAAWIDGKLPLAVSFPTETGDARQLVRLWANLKLAVSLAERTKAAGHTDRAQALWTTGSLIDQALTQSVSESVVRAWGWQRIYQLVALSQKVNRPDLSEYWVNQVRLWYPSKDYKYLYDLRDPYAQSALSDAYASLGLMDDALHVGEQALAVHNWDWGHFVIAGYYRQQQRWDDAERHLLAAVASAENVTLMNDYRLALADLYRLEGKRELAITQLCHILAGRQGQTSEGNSEVLSTLTALSGNLDSCIGAR